MPSAAFHSNYWAGSADAGTPPPDPPTSSGVPSYVTWMSNITIRSVAGFLGTQMFQALYERWRQVRRGHH